MTNLERLRMYSTNEIKRQGCPIGQPISRYSAWELDGFLAIIKDDDNTVIGTGVCIAIPEYYVGLVLPRSGLAKDGIVAIPGTIDAGYRGEIKVLLYNLACVDKFVVHVGDRIAQLVILPVARADFQRVEDLPPGDRAENGFGSTGR